MYTPVAPTTVTFHYNANWNAQRQQWHTLLLHFNTMPTGTHRQQCVYTCGTHYCYISLQCQLKHTEATVAHTAVTFYYNANWNTQATMCTQLCHTLLLHFTTMPTASAASGLVPARVCAHTHTHIHRHISQAEPGPKDFLPALQN